MSTFNDPDNLISLIPENLRDTELFTVLRDLLQVSRDDLAVKMDRLENLNNVDREGDAHHDNFVAALVGSDLISLGYQFDSIAEIVSVSRILYTHKGTTRALETALRLLDVPFQVYEGVEAEAVFPRKLECEILLVAPPEFSPTLEDFDRARDAMDIFMWICIDPLFMLNLLFDEEIVLQDSFLSEVAQSVGTDVYAPCPTLTCAGYPSSIPLRFGDDWQYDGDPDTGDDTWFFPNLIQPVTFDTTNHLLTSEFLQFEKALSYQIIAEFYGDSTRVLFDYGTGGSVFRIEVVDRRLRATVGVQVLTLSTPLLSEGWNRLNFRHTLTTMSLGSAFNNQSFFLDPASVSGTGLYLIDNTGGVRQVSIERNDKLILETPLVETFTQSNAIIFGPEGGIRVSDFNLQSEFFQTTAGTKCLGIVRDFGGDSLSVSETVKAGGWLEIDPTTPDSETIEYVYAVENEPDEVDDSEFELDEEGDLVLKETPTNADFMFEDDPDESENDDVILTTYTPPEPDGDPTLRSDALEGGYGDFADNFPDDFNGNAFEQENFGWLVLAEDATVIDDPTMEVDPAVENTEGDLQIKDSAETASTMLYHYMNPDAPEPTLHVFWDIYDERAVIPLNGTHQPVGPWKNTLTLTLTGPGTLELRTISAGEETPLSGIASDMQAAIDASEDWEGTAVDDSDSDQGIHQIKIILTAVPDSDPIPVLRVDYELDDLDFGLFEFTY